jgi:hypothetical protein
MIESCFTYGGADRDTYNYQRYIQDYRKHFGEEMFNKVYEEHLDYLKTNATIEHNVYTDAEGCSYNSLKINK